MQTPPLVPSSDIELETGLGKDLLRKWRQRYGFPLPEASADGKVGYSRQIISQLLLIKRLLEGGFQPAQVVGKTPLELGRLHRAITNDRADSRCNESTRKFIERLKQTDLVGLQALLVKQRATGTLTEFVSNTVAPLLIEVGEAWSRGEIEIYHEHLCTSVIERCLHAEILSSKPKRGYPKILFATPPDEHHALGLLMAEAALAGQGAKTVSLGSNTPLNDLKMAAISCQANVVAISFSFAYPARRVRPVITHLRHLLPADIQIWVGGKGSDITRRPQKGVRIFSDVQETIGALHDLTKQNRS
jgi:methylmalonyl-CoA mutase cobalamin-binding subunit